MSYGILVSNGHNLIGGNPLLGPLQDNGGLTLTHALLADSPALNAGLNADAAAFTTDQRGFARISGGQVDIGAVEKTADERIIDLRSEVSAASIHHGTMNALTAKLNAALAAWAINDVTAACANVNAFISQVNAQRGKKIPVALADSLIADANAIRTALGCAP